MNHGDRSSNSEYYLPRITIYQVSQYHPFNLMNLYQKLNEPYVYSRSNLNDISQNKQMCTKIYEKTSN